MPNKKPELASDPAATVGDVSADVTLDYAPGATPSGSTGTFTVPPVVITTRYEILSELGSGGMGLVYRARDRETGEIVALKVLRPAVASNPRMAERFKNELRLARQITHKNVCRIHEFNREGATAYITMEMVAGESLRQVLERFETLSVRTSLKIAAQICAALREAHQLGIVHRDLKPENIMLDAAAQAKVMDFGIARSLKQESDAEPAIIGTPAYMSPEQAEGKAADARSDIYALGLILYEMLTGRPGVSGNTSSEMVRNTIQETPKPPRDLEPTIPASLEHVILKCMEKDPRRRFQSVAELEAALNDPHFGEALEDPEPESRLLRWGVADWVLLAAGVVALVFFLSYRDRVFPAAHMPLELDAISARRAAQQVAERLGRPFPNVADARLIYDQEVFLARVYARNINTLEQVDFPVYWRVGAKASAMDFLSGTPPERYVLLDRHGRVEEFVNTAGTSSLTSTYVPPRSEERRRIATAALAQMCGAPPGTTVLTETPGGERGASYKAVWTPRAPVGSTTWGEVELFGENLVAIRCRPVIVTDTNWPTHRIPEQKMRTFAAGFLAFALLAPVVWFGMGQCHRSPLLLPRLPLAVIAGGCGAWAVGDYFRASDSITGLIAVGFPLTAVFLIGLVAVEDRLRKRVPGSIASYVLALKGRVLEDAVALAVIRGALGGLVLLAVETLLMFGSLNAPRSSMLRKILAPAVFVDPAPIGHALANPPSALFVLASVIFHVFAVGVLLLGSGMGDSRRYLEDALRSRKLMDRVGVVIAVIGSGAASMLAFMAGPVHIFQPAGMGPLSLFVPLTFGMLFGVLILWYDLLTGMVAVATVVLWSLNYPLLGILEQVGNGANWGVFVLWGVLVTGAAAIAFRDQLGRIAGRLRQEMEK